MRMWSVLADRIECAALYLPEAAALDLELRRLQAVGVGDPAARLVASRDHLAALYSALESAR